MNIKESPSGAEAAEKTEHKTERQRKPVPREASLSICFPTVLSDTERSGHLEWRLHLSVLGYNCCLTTSPATSLKLIQTKEEQEASFDLAKVNALPRAPERQPPPGVANFVIVNGCVSCGVHRVKAVLN